MYLEDYSEAIRARVDRLLATQVSAITAAGELLGDSLAKGAIAHLFGSGHSALVVRDVVSRAGGLVPLNQIVDQTMGLAEPLEGYGELILRSYDEQYQLLPTEVLLLVSHSGANPLPVDIALKCRDRGMRIITLLSREQAEHSEARHPSGLRLHEVADVVIDTGGVFGDALVMVNGTQAAVGPGSGVLGTLALQLVVMSACDTLNAQGVALPVFMSKHLSGAGEWNAGLRAKYRGRLRRTAT